MVRLSLPWQCCGQGSTQAWERRVHIVARARPGGQGYPRLLSLLKYSEVTLADWMDVIVTASAYWVNLTLHEMFINGVKVVAAQVPYIILGRDVLNQCHITLAGPNLALEIKVEG